MKQRRGELIWEGKHITWEYQAFEETSLSLRPHFKIVATDPSTHESVTWPNIEIDSNSLDQSIKGITDFTKLPRELMHRILDNCVAKLNEDESVTRLNPYAQ